jgi:hypothetical protein
MAMASSSEGVDDRDSRTSTVVGVVSAARVARSIAAVVGSDASPAPTRITRTAGPFM